MLVMDPNPSFIFCHKLGPFACAVTGAAVVTVVGAGAATALVVVASVAASCAVPITILLKYIAHTPMMMTMMTTVVMTSTRFLLASLSDRSSSNISLL
jgi:hypothetical protein